MSLINTNFISPLVLFHARNDIMGGLLISSRRWYHPRMYLLVTASACFDMHLTIFYYPWCSQIVSAYECMEDKDSIWSNLIYRQTQQHNETLIVRAHKEWITVSCTVMQCLLEYMSIIKLDAVDISMIEVYFCMEV